MAHKYLDKLNVPEENRPDLWCQHDKRQKHWKKQRKKYGFDNRELWSMDVTFYCWLYERLCRYLKVAGSVINLDYHRFEYEDEEMTQRQCINRMLEGLEIALTKPENKLTEEDKKKINDVASLWAIVLPAMWY